MTSVQSRTVPSSEMRRDTEALLAANPEDNLAWLEAERNLEAASREEAFAVESMVLANQHAKRANHFADCVAEMRKLREITGHMTTALRGRIIVAVTEARPEWRPTHRHYKGTLYRVTGTRANSEGEELVEGIEYDDEKGTRYFIRRDRWESLLDSGRPRYQPLYPEEVR